MSRTIGAALLAHLATATLTLARCVKVTLVNGTVWGFTGHDKNLVFGGVTYLATSAVDATQARATLGHQLDNIEVMGLLQSAVIDDDDLVNGLYDGAAVEVFTVNWADNPIVNRIIEHTGTIGEVTLTEGRWLAEFRPISARLTHQVGQLTSPTCRVKELGDAECAPGGFFADGVTPLTTYQRTGKLVTVVTDRYQLTFGAVTDATGYFDYGRCAFTTGPNIGLSREVKKHTLTAGTAVIVLQEPFPRAVVVGNAATLEAGCDRTIELCRSRFANAANHRGEPGVPGVDTALIRGRKG